MTEEDPAMFNYQAFWQRHFDVVTVLRAEIEGVFNLRDIQTAERGESVVFVGRLLHSAEETYRTLKDRFARLGYTPLLRREGEVDVIVAQKGIVGLSRSNLLINAGLLLLTIFTTLFAGASFARVNVLSAFSRALTTGDVGLVATALMAGAPFAITLLLILGVHEMGHYLAARLHGVQVTLPYFIPVPFGLGTMGAFIQLKSPVENRKALFDVGLAGPVAGFAVALPLMIIGLLLSEVVPARGANTLGASLLLRWLTDLIQPHAAGSAVSLHPIAIAAWFGILITGINLLPMGQLDGGHVTYAVLGKAAHKVAYAVFALMLLGGITVWSGWLTWALFTFFTGLRHAPPLNDITPLDPLRKFIGALTLLWFLLIITPKPF